MEHANLTTKEFLNCRQMILIQEAIILDILREVNKLKN